MATDSSNSEWQAYADYDVSSRVAESIDDAVMAYSTLEAMMSEGASIDPGQASDCRRKIQTAAMRVLVDMQESNDERFDDILEDWVGEDREGGYIQEFQDCELGHNLPGWLFTFVMQIREAGWKLGYVRAGRREPGTPSSDDDEEEQIQQEIQSMVN
jgi:hypothetical protein